MNFNGRLKAIPTTFDENFLFEVAISLLVECGLCADIEGRAHSPYMIFSALEDEVFNARLEAETQERSDFMELLELMLWSTYKHWKPMAENVMSGNSKKPAFLILIRSWLPRTSEKILAV